MPQSICDKKVPIAFPIDAQSNFSIKVIVVSNRPMIPSLKSFPKPFQSILFHAPLKPSANFLPMVVQIPGVLTNPIKVLIAILNLPTNTAHTFEKLTLFNELTKDVPIPEPNTFQFVLYMKLYSASVIPSNP